MIEPGSIVKLNLEYTCVLNPDMIEWISVHKEDSFYVEKICETSVKLKRVDFWITFDLLTEIINNKEI